MDRRAFLRLTTGAAAMGTLLTRDSTATPLDFARPLRRAPARAILSDSARNHKVRVVREWRGNLCTIRVRNEGKESVRLREIVVAELEHGFPLDTPFYGESFQMLSQTAGTIAQPQTLGYDELKHYKIPQPDGVTALSGLLAFLPERGDSVVLAFTSCRRFIGRFYLQGTRLQVVLDAENVELGAGESCDAEELMLQEGPKTAELLSQVAARIRRNHPSVFRRPVATGWCSWYCFGPRVTAQQVLDNLDVIATQVPGLKYVQIDDGYQAAMGD